MSTELSLYSFSQSKDVVTPALIYYKELIRQNIEAAIKISQGSHRLWPHVKSHKMAEAIRLSMEYGIERFKCSTIAEAETAASCGAKHIMLAYPLIGINIKRFVALKKAYLACHFYAIGDDIKALTSLGKTALESNDNVDVLIDVNTGMNRTGVLPENLLSFYDTCSSIQGITLKGLHCYDGHRTEQSYTMRQEKAHISDEKLHVLWDTIQKKYPLSTLIVLGGTPSFPCHVDFKGAFLSPGTYFVYDYGYSKKFPDLPFTPAAAILTRVISHPDDGIFTIDLGYKGIASDPVGIRGHIVNLGHYEELFQSEEHWTFQMKPGYQNLRPNIGDELFVIPTHICPTSALYPFVHVVENGAIKEKWAVTARNRKLNF